MIPLEEYLTPPVSTRETITEPEAQDAAEKLYGTYQKFAFLSMADPRCKEIAASAQSMIAQLEIMQLPGATPYDIYMYAINSQSLLNKNLELLKASNPQIEQKTTTLSLMGDQFETKLKNASISTSPLNFSPKTALERFEENPLWLDLQEKRNQNEAIAKMGNAICSLVKECINDVLDEVGGNIERFQKEGFDPSNPHSLFHLKETKNNH